MRNKHCKEKAADKKGAAVLTCRSFFVFKGTDNCEGMLKSVIL